MTRAMVPLIALAALGVATLGARPVAAQNVLVAGAEFNAAWIDEVKSKIVGTGLITGNVDVMSLMTVTPSLSDLAKYDAVLVFTDNAPLGTDAFGDALASYVDCGGGVVSCVFAHYTSWAIGGRWSTGGYAPFTLSLGTDGTLLTLGTVAVPDHPVMAGVASFSGGSASFHGTGAAVGTVIASWSSGEPLVVDRTGFVGKIVGLNFFAPSSTSRADFWDETTDGAKLMANALKYVAHTFSATLSTPVANAGVDALVQVTATAGMTGSVFYRKVGGATTFNTVAMTANVSNAAILEATIPAADVGQDGVQYYVDITDACLVQQLPAGVPARCATLRVNRSTTIDVPAGAFAMVGVPFAPSDAAPEAVFDELGPYNIKHWRYGVYDPTVSPPYRQPPDAPGVNPGQAFWIRAKTATSAAVAGLSTDVPANVRITLQVGFNQISDPYSFPVQAADLVLPPSVESNLIVWSGGSYIPGNTTLSPGVGYWIKNNGPDNQVIEIPAFPPPSPAPARGAPGVLREDDAGWSVQAIASVGSFSDGGNRFGMRSDATDAKDTFDFSDPPAPPADFVTLSLIGEDGTPLYSDYRRDSQNGAQWRLQLASDQAGQPFRVAFDPDRELPAGWVLRAFGPGGLRETDLSADGVLTGTVGSAPFQREWTIAAGTPEWTESVRSELSRSASTFSFSAPIPNPSRGPSFDLALPEAAHVDARVFDVTGRAVRTLVDGQLERGYHLLEWNGADASGRRVASGVYFVRLRTGQHDESRKVVLLQ